MREVPKISGSDPHLGQLRVRYGYHKPAVVVHVAGVIDVDTMPAVQHGVQEALKGAVAPFPVVLDLLAVTILSEACLDAVVTLHHLAHRQRTPLHVVGDGDVLGVLAGAELDRDLSIYPTLAAATQVSAPPGVEAATAGHNIADCPECSSVAARNERGGGRSRRAETLRIESTVRDGVVVVVPVGVLDVVSYARVRTALVKLALDVPRALIVDMAKLVVPDDASLVVFTSVWKEVSEWPGLPLHLVAANDATKMRLRRNGIFRRIPVHDTVDQAIAGIDQPPSWRRAVFTIPHGGANGNKARRCIERTCHRWACVEDIIADATVIAFELLENAMRRSADDVRLRLELRCGKLIVAVHDNTPTHVVAGSARHTRQRLGLAQVDSLAYSWGSAPAFPQGTVVWAALRV